MRRALLQQLPALSFHFGIHPWQVDDLRNCEIEVYLDALDELTKKG